MTIKEALNLGLKKTKSTLDSEVLLSHVLNKPREYLFANPDLVIKPKQAKLLAILLARRQLGEPVAYIKKEKEFFGRKFLVTKDVLIPRPETETLVELVLERIKNPGTKILDIGTGSGCIIISIAKHLERHPELVSRHQFSASDISKKALVVAKQNAKLHKVKITFKQGSLLTPWGNQKFDIIIANLPYLWKLEHPSTKFEPKKALLADKKGLDLYEKLFSQIAKLDHCPQIFIEFDPRQTQQIKKLASQYLPAYKIIIHKDLAGRNRIGEIKKTR